MRQMIIPRKNKDWVPLKYTDEGIAYLCDGVDGVPALAQHLRVGVVHEPHEAGQKHARVCAVVQPCSREVPAEDGDGRLPQPSVCSSRGLQQILDDDSLADFILHREDHSLTVAQLLQRPETPHLHRRSKLWFIKKYILRTKSAFIWSKIQY